jgi:hypothetical protein
MCNKERGTAMKKSIWKRCKDVHPTVSGYYKVKNIGGKYSGGLCYYETANKPKGWNYPVDGMEWDFSVRVTI